MSNPIEALGVATGIVAVWLTTRQNIWCWPVGIVSVALFVVVFFTARLYAAMGLQVVYIVLAFYGWYAWLHGGEGHGQLRVSRVPARRRRLLLGIGAVGAVVLGFTLSTHTDARVPWLDASLTSFSLVAQFMQTRKWIENWLLWTVIDVLYVAMSLSQGLRLTSVLYATYLVLAVIGWFEWRRALTPPLARAE